MKKNKKFMKTTPVTETKNTTPVPGSVGEFIELLKEFPADEKFTVNGSIGIGDYDTIHYSIEPTKSVDEAVLDAINNLSIDDTIDEYDESDNVFMELHKHGIGYGNADFADSIRLASTDELLSSPIMNPNTMQIKFEGVLHPNQYLILDEIRAHNVEVAEALAELHRREIAALLEYNTQCLAHFGINTNNSMCEIIDNNKKK